MDGVIAGRILACRWVRLFCERHKRDLKQGRKRGLYFDQAAAEHALEFFAYAKHSKGRWAGKPFLLEPWQQAIIWVLFGWYRRKTKTRRFRATYIEIARKNGKSLFGSALGLYMLLADGEPGAEVYSAATKRDQARITFDEAARMVKASPYLSEHIKTHKDRLFVKWDTASKYEPLGRDSDTMDGLNVHCAVVDELHAHRTSETWDVLETGMGARTQALMLGITTAGFNQSSFCYDQRKYAAKVLDGVLVDDAFFAIIFTLDDGDDPWDERMWGKANPNLGVSVDRDELRDLAGKAREMPSALTSFLTKRLNIWTRAAHQWIHPDKWRACGGTFDPATLAGRRCYGGLDLSSTTDITAWVLIFPPTEADPFWRVLPRFWVPDDAMSERVKRDRVPYDVWAKQGYIELIPGEVIDYEFVYAQIDRDAQMYDLQEVAFDRWGAASTYLWMASRGLVVVATGQGYQSMNAPMKELEKLILSKKLAHGDNPVLTWMAYNRVATMDPTASIKPDKKKSIEKIDGMMGLILAISRAMTFDAEGAGSMYDDPAIVAG
jgi:phage terminase large subunit-like protein